MSESQKASGLVRTSLTVDIEGERLDRFVTSALPRLSRSRVQALIRNGSIRVDGEEAKASMKPNVGARIEVVEPPPQPTEMTPEEIPLDFLYSDEDLAVLVKPAGMVVHPGPGHSSGTLVHALLHALEGLSVIGGKERPGIVHRLDKGTSGVMVVARNDVTHRGLQEQFAEHSIDRRYLAVVLGGPDLLSGTCRSQHGRHPRDRLRFASVETGGKTAVTRWKRREKLGRASLLECTLETGRTHQVRVHLSEAGWPILGDPLYFGRWTPPLVIREALTGVRHQLLHACHLSFTHPKTGERMTFDAPPPDDFQRVRGVLAET